METQLIWFFIALCAARPPNITDEGYDLLLALMHSGQGCWRPAYGRGVGHIFDSCESGQELSLLLCYPTCKTGYTG